MDNVTYRAMLNIIANQLGLTTELTKSLIVELAKEIEAESPDKYSKSDNITFGE
jgi:hypothetical protein